MSPDAPPPPADDDFKLPSLPQKQSPTLSLTAAAAPRQTPRSDTLGHELRLRQVFGEHPQAPHEQRIAVSLRVLDDIGQTLAGKAVQTVLAVVRRELDEAIYSHMLTSSSSTAADNSADSVERVPYFVLAGRLLAARAADEQRHQQAAIDTERALKMRDRDIAVVNKKNFNLRQQLADLTAKLAASEEQCQQLQQTIAAHEQTIGGAAEAQQRLQQQHAAHAADLTSRLEAANRTVDQLSQARVAYQTLEKKPALVSTVAATAKKRYYTDTIHGIMERDGQELEQMRIQMNRVVAAQVAEYDALMQRLFTEYTVMRTHQPLTDAARDLLEEKYDRETQTARRLFSGHLQSCVDELKLIEESRVTARDAAVKWKRLEVDRNVAFVEWFRRRSDGVKIGASVDGCNTFFSLHTGALVSESEDDDQQCVQCNEQTFLCPHMAIVNTAALPAACTHIRLELVMPSGAAVDALDGDGLTDGTAQPEVAYEYLNDQISRNMRRIWKDFYVNRNGSRPMFPRKLSYEHLRWHIDEVCLRRRDAEEHGMRVYMGVGLPSATATSSVVDGGDNFLDFFYGVMDQNYTVLQARSLAVYEILCGLQAYESRDDTVQLFVRHLSGSDDVVNNYVELVDELLDTVNINQNVSNYRKALRLLYPYRAVTDFYDQLELDQIAFTQNQIDHVSFRRHLVRQLAGNQEPNVFALYALLSQQQALSSADPLAGLSVEDYTRWLRRVFPPVPSRLVQYRMQILLANLPPSRRPAKNALVVSGGVGIPLKRLAMLTSYLVLWCQKTWCRWTGIVAHRVVNGDAVQEFVFNGMPLTRELFNGKTPFLDVRQMGQGRMAPPPAQKPHEQSITRRASVMPDAVVEADVFGWLDPTDGDESLLEQRARWADIMDLEESGL